MGIERQAAYDDLGLTIDAADNNQEVDAAKVDIVGFTADIQQILRIVAAVKNNN